MKERTYTVLVGGKAGEGVKKAAQVIAGVFCSRGLHACQADDYQSLIKGGHNFSVVTAGAAEIECVHQQWDLLICFDQRSVDEHLARLKTDGSIYYNSDEATCERGFGLPMNALMKKHYQGPANVSMAAIAIFAAVMRMSKDMLKELIKRQYKRDVSENTTYAYDIYDLITSHTDLLDWDATPLGYRFLSGNQAIILGAWKAGLDMYYGYPMTPASSLLHYAALKQDSLGIQAIHAESELAAVNMALGSALAGCRVAVGSSGGGFALMQEAFSAAGMVEAPLLCVLSSRPGPATGVSTYTAQEDLWFSLFQGHGEFNRIVASPDSISRALSLSAELLSLSWEFQVPSILLTEKQLSEGLIDLRHSSEPLPEAEPQTGIPGKDYKRYQDNLKGVSPLLFPGSQFAPETVIKWSTHEHLESGLRTDKADEIVLMKDKRQKKAAGISYACSKFQTFAEYGEGERLIFAYGSTVLELREALKFSALAFRIVAPVYLEPFPLGLEKYRGASAIVVEHSSSGQFAQFLKWKLDIRATTEIKKYDGRPFDPEELSELIREASHA